MGVLDRILADKRKEIETLRNRQWPLGPAPRPVQLGRDGGRVRLITEIKLRSPSAGPLSRVLSIGERARCYADNGADMLSVLCDQPHFEGSYEHLRIARDSCDLPLLAKEFILDEVQLDVARAHGADAVLLIVRCLSPERLNTLVAAAQERGLQPLVEVANESEAQVAVDAQADLVGVNARNLDTLAMDVEGAGKILELLPAEITAVHLSGLKSPADVLRVRETKASSALIGEALMRQDDPGPLLRSLRAAAEGQDSAHSTAMR